MKAHALNSILQSAFVNSTVDRLKPASAVTISSKASCGDALEAMISKKVGCLLVVNPDKALSGIITERDFLLKVWRLKDTWSSQPIEKYMTPGPQSLKYSSSVAKAIYLMTVGGFRHIPILLKDGELGVLSSTDFTRFILEKINLRIKRQDLAQEIFAIDNSVDLFFEGVVSLLPFSEAIIEGPQTACEKIIESMIAHKVGAVAIGDPKLGSITGIFSERDLLKRVFPNRAGVLHAPISEHMTLNPTVLQRSATVLFALEKMVEGHFRHIPIVDQNNKLTGMLSVKDFVSHIGESIVKELA